MEKIKNTDEISIEIGTDGEEAYRILAEWVKSAPKTMDDIKKNGTKEDLKKYQLQIKMVLEKLKTIESEITK
ncbi:MAG: hypothetical protein HOB40_06395 [Candidatus Marinimicrobia bacterium]|jgi:hypothetical protein|nr:hypothetical protein [Candidatus Neomarinimicrobiota bacterium]MBT3502798.1 hypothetical protein [Candidatus Neomarinimicrobiota bacterium]MBT3838963.1 hypothetical protein [Candidatus Neomarinimicrobiota bacterium]MBT3999694.1 hypothetical protein [Candidatus Neomarinimicrobiota bacterium]MBT4282463.1 hypothetical protein [Candidatus Neomarinimicrobiota bacterium]